MPVSAIHLIKEVIRLPSEKTVAIDDAKCKISEDCITIDGNTITINASIDGMNYQCMKEIDSISIQMVIEDDKIASARIFRSKVKCERFIFGDETGQEAKHVRRLMEACGFTRRQESLMLIVTDAVSYVISSLFMSRPKLNATANEMIHLRKKFFITGWRRRISASRVHTMLRKAIDGEEVSVVDEEMLSKQEVLRKLKSESLSSTSSSSDEDDPEDKAPFFILNNRLAFREIGEKKIDLLFNYSLAESLLLECCTDDDKKLVSITLRCRSSKRNVVIPVNADTCFNALIEVMKANSIISDHHCSDRLMVEKMLAVLVRTAFNRLIPSRGEKIVLIDFTVNSTKIISDVKKTGWSRDITRFNTSQKLQDVFNIDYCNVSWKSL